MIPQIKEQNWLNRISLDKGADSSLCKPRSRWLNRT
jgi:hypothetical protein